MLYEKSLCCCLFRRASYYFAVLGSAKGYRYSIGRKQTLFGFAASNINLGKKLQTTMAQRRVSEFFFPVQIHQLSPTCTTRKKPLLAATHSGTERRNAVSVLALIGKVKPPFLSAKMHQCFPAFWYLYWDVLSDRSLGDSHFGINLHHCSRL